MWSKVIFPLTVLLFLSIVQKNLANVNELQFLRSLTIDTEIQKDLVRHAVSFLSGVSTDDKNNNALFASNSKLFNLYGDFSNLTILNGFAKMCDGNITGLNSFVRDIKTELGSTFDIVVKLGIGNISVISKNEVDMSIQNVIKFQSFGDFLFEIMNAGLNVRLKIGPISPLTVQEFVIEKLSIADIGITGVDTMMNGIEDFDFIFEGIVAFWNQVLEPIAEKTIATLLRGLLKNCTLADLIAFTQGKPLTCAGLGGEINLPIEYPDELKCGGRPTSIVIPPVEATTESNASPLRFHFVIPIMSFMTFWILKN